MATQWNDGVTHRTGYARRMSTHLAAALVTFCLLQIFIVARMGGSLLLHLGIIIAIGGFAVAARGLEQRWEMLDPSGLSSQGLALRFRRDLVQLWSASIIGGLLWIPVSIIFRALFG
ncbi:hypothetical protein Sphch_2438 [Sphingobium chlorophenolicum L-1]|uniref:Transmembrane protein n=2 Tax=Sphingobium chlorophenolicum TaxID=46429 RepID=F6EYP6_SPHCR|nr:hypothetical protein Sphch_2438 [Sphingobium chlorophenolicum L-1]